MAQKEAREKLVEFLDRKVFDPILAKSEDESSAPQEKEKWQDIQASPESEKRRFHQDYRTAEAVKDNYQSDLSSDTGKRISAEARGAWACRRCRACGTSSWSYATH
jgi:hypothetical protein